MAHSPARLRSLNGIYKPIPASSVNGECKFSGVLECSIIFYLQVTKGKACQSNPSSTRRLNRGSCHTPKFALHLLKIFHTSMLKDSSRVDQTNSLLDNQPQTRVWQFSDPDGLPTSPMVFMPPHMFQRFSMSNFKPHKSSFLRQLLRWLKISCIGQNVNCGQHTVKTFDFWSTSSF